jgi:hypothetical protein
LQLRRTSRRRRRFVLVGLVLAAAAVALLLTAIDGGEHQRTRPPLALLRGPHARVEARLRPLVAQEAARVERIRGLEFRQLPTVTLMGEGRLAALGRRLARHERRRVDLSRARVRRADRLERASVDFDQLAGLLPPEFSFGPDTKGGLDRVGGAFDYSKGRIIIVPELIETRDQLDYTLAHELAHALENEHFKLRLATLSDPSERSGVRRAVIEGTATFVQDLYRQRYLHDQVPVAQRLEGMRSVIGTGPGAYAINAQTIFDYVDGALFVRDLYRRAGGWRLVNRALKEPPRRSTQILHPRTWPAPVTAPPIHLGITPLLAADWEPVGGGAADEERALVILLAGTIATEAASGAAGWDGGRFAVWRPGSRAEDCSPDCAAGDVGVIAFRWRHRHDAEQFALAVPAYMLAGLFAERVGERIWKLSDAYAALGTATRGSALAFAPTGELAQRLSQTAARNAAPVGR